MKKKSQAGDLTRAKFCIRKGTLTFELLKKYCSKQYEIGEDIYIDMNKKVLWSGLLGLFVFVVFFRFVMAALVIVFSFFREAQEAEVYGVYAQFIAIYFISATLFALPTIIFIFKEKTWNLQSKTINSVIVELGFLSIPLINVIIYNLFLSFIPENAFKSIEMLEYSLIIVSLILMFAEAFVFRYLIIKTMLKAQLQKEAKI